MDCRPRATGTIISALLVCICHINVMLSVLLCASYEPVNVSESDVTERRIVYVSDGGVSEHHAFVVLVVYCRC